MTKRQLRRFVSRAKRRLEVARRCAEIQRLLDEQVPLGVGADLVERLVRILDNRHRHALALRLKRLTVLRRDVLAVARDARAVANGTRNGTRRVAAPLTC